MVLFDFSTAAPSGPRARGCRGPLAFSSGLERWTRFVLRFRWPVLAAWLAAARRAASTLSLVLPAHLANSFAVPGNGLGAGGRRRSPAASASGPKARSPSSSACATPPTRSADAPARAGSSAPRACCPAAALGTFRAGGGVVYGELATTLEPAAREGATPTPLRRALAGGRPAALVTGQPAIQHDLDPQLASDLRRGEALALPLALLVLAFVLGLSLALAIPFVFAACTIGGTLALLYATAQIVAVTLVRDRTSSS